MDVTGSPGVGLVVGAVVVRRGPGGPQVLAARRTTPPVGLWEFPGGKVEPGETPSAALVREVREELGCDVTVGAEVTDDGRAWPVSATLELRLHLVELTGGEPAPGDSHDLLRWLAPEELDAVTWLPTDERALGHVRAALRAG